MGATSIQSYESTAQRAPLLKKAMQGLRVNMTNDEWKSHYDDLEKYCAALELSAPQNKYLEARSCESLRSIFKHENSVTKFLPHSIRDTLDKAILMYSALELGSLSQKGFEHDMLKSLTICQTAIENIYTILNSPNGPWRNGDPAHAQTEFVKITKGALKFEQAKPALVYAQEELVAPLIKALAKHRSISVQDLQQQIAQLQERGFDEKSFAGIDFFNPIDPAQWHLFGAAQSSGLKNPLLPGAQAA